MHLLTHLPHAAFWILLTFGSLASCFTSVKKPVPATPVFGELQPVSLSVAWDRHEDNNVTGFRLYRGSVSRDYSSVVDIPGRESTGYTFPSVDPGETFYLAATAYNAEGMESDFSEELVIRPPKILSQKIVGDQFHITLDYIWSGFQYGIESTPSLSPPITWTNRIATQVGSVETLPDGRKKMTLAVPMEGLGPTQFFRVKMSAQMMGMKR